MAFKTIMSPAVAAHYPLCVKEVFVAPGELVKPDTRALLAETAEGRRIAIKCGHEGRVIQAPLADAILDERKMLLVIETFADEPASAPEDDGPAGKAEAEEQERAQQEQARKERAAREAQQAHQAAYAQASGQKESIRPAQTEPSAAQEAETATASASSDGPPDEQPQEPSEGAQPLHGAGDGTKEEEAGKASNAPSGKKIALVAAGFVVVLLGGAVAMQFLEEKPTSPSRTPSASTVSTKSAPVPASTKPTAPKPLPTRPYPAEQDRDWKKIPNINSQNFVRYVSKNSKARDIEFLSLDAGRRRVQLVGRADKRSIVTSYSFSGNGPFRNVRYLNTDPEKAFIFADYPQRDVSTVLISPKNKKSEVSAYHYFGNRKPDKKTGAFKKGYSLEYAVKDGGLMALLLQNTESYSQNMLVSNEKGKTEAYRIWSDPYDLSNYSDYGSHIALDVHSKDGIKQGTALVSGSRSTLFAPSNGYLNGIRIKAQSSSVTLEGTKAQIFKPQDILPKGVFQKYTSLGGGIRMTAAAVDTYRKSFAMGGVVWGMGNQKNEDGSSRVDAYLVWTADGKTDLRRMFVRNDSNWKEGLVIRDLEFYGNGQLAVLLRENEGKPYSAVVFFDRSGNLKNRYSYSNAIVNDIDSYGDTLYGAGFATDKGRRYGAIWKF
ncbi:hypothetical protein [Cohaesibacter marisflavi]|uniref:hypothetical protein n=1 Tax=Cohaesibacter marisflavi TaxID=655353 RepID=UPI0029C89919|nr:hypothetical protein [Cohaesibacter marisflavi]